MSQYDFGTIDPSTKDGTQLATDLNAWRTALHSSHKGTSRPSYAIAGTTWVNDSTNPLVLNFYDGTDDIPIGSFNTTTNKFSLVAASVTNASIAFDGGAFGFRNRIINGDMAIAQRGTSISTGTGVLTYTADRWIAAATGAALTATITTAATSAPYSYISLGGAASNTAFNIRQRIESKNVRDLAGKEVTVSFNYYNSGGGNATNLKVFLASADLADDFTTTTAISNSAVAVTTGRQSLTFTLSAASYKGLEVMFSGDALTAGAIVLFDVQLEEGPTATPFERRSYATEFDLCQRYYQIRSGVSYIYRPTAGDSTYEDRSLPVEMRSSPTVTKTGTYTYTNTTAGAYVWTATSSRMRLVSNSTTGSPSLSGVTSAATVTLEAEL